MREKKKILAQTYLPEQYTSNKILLNQRAVAYLDIIGSKFESSPCHSERCKFLLTLMMASEVNSRFWPRIVVPIIMNKT